MFAGPFPLSGEKQAKLQGMDPQVLVDGLAVIMGHEEKELCKAGHLALVLILETATTILGTKERVSHLDMIAKIANLSMLILSLC